jgi:hypothetical protein
MGDGSPAGFNAESHGFHVQAEVKWTAAKNLKVTFGVDVFGGKPNGLFGRYDDRDRVYTEARWSF